MPNFRYKIVTKDQQIKEGAISSPFGFSARKNLTRDGSSVLLLSKEKSPILQVDAPFLSGFPLGEKIYFFRNLAMMVDSGISIVEALEIISEQVKTKKVKKAILKISDDVRNGQKLSDAMRKFPKYFPEHIVENVNMGITAGRLNETLDRISNDFEKDDELRKKVTGAIAYPLIIVVVMIAVLIIFIFYVLPGIAEMFFSLEVATPLPTRILLGIGSFLKTKPLVIPGIFFGFLLFISIGLKFKKTKYFLHKILLRLPIFGDLIKNYNLVLFFRSLESLSRSGVPIVSTVEIAAKTTNNEVYKRALDRVKPLLLQGISLSDALSPFTFLFSKQTRKIITVGERAGKMDEAFHRISEYYLRVVDHKTRMLTVLIEPILMLVLGVFVAIIALSLFLPLYGLMSTLSQ